MTVRVVLPAPLRTIARLGPGELTLEVQAPVTRNTVLDAIEARYPMLLGTIRDHGRGQRRAFLRFYACERDLTFEDPDAPLPDAVARGEAPFLVIGAIAGG